MTQWVGLMVVIAQAVVSGTLVITGHALARLTTSHIALARVISSRPGQAQAQDLVRVNPVQVPPRPATEGGVWGSYVGYLAELERLVEEHAQAMAELDGAVADLTGFTCVHCGATSHSSHDVEYGYCGACHHFCKDIL